MMTSDGFKPQRVAIADDGGPQVDHRPGAAIERIDGGAEVAGGGSVDGQPVTVADFVEGVFLVKTRHGMPAQPLAPR